MHTLMLRTQFVSQHYLIGKDFGRENFKHSHHYTFELEIAGQQLDAYNYLIDIIDLRKHMDNLVTNFSDKTLNELPEFSNQNPSLELFSKILWQKINDNFQLPIDCQLTVRLWEDTIAQASYRGSINSNYSLKN